MKVFRKYSVSVYIFLFTIACCAFAPDAAAQCAVTVSSFPYQEDFEATNGGWTAGGIFNDWSWGVPSKPVISGAGSGSKCWIIGGTSASFYNFSESSYVESPCFNFSSLTNPSISLRVFWETEFKYDGANLQYSLNGGNSWTNVGAYGDVIDCENQNWYNYASVNYLTLATVKNGWCGNIQPSSGSCQGGGGSGTWKLAKHTMPYLAGQASVKFRIIFGAGIYCNSYDGFAFDDVTIKNAAAPIVVNSVLQPAGCTFNNGAATLTVNGGTPPYVYTWNPNVSASNVAANLGVGNYTTTITDAAGCSRVNYITISHTPDVSIAASEVPDTCQRNVGAATVTVSSGTPPFSYLWNPTGSIAASVNNLSEGSYSVTVSDAQGCTAAETVTIDIYGAFAFNLGNDTTICSANGFILTPGNFAQYLWQDLSTDSVFNVRLPGMYWVEVTAASGCKSADTLQVIEDCLHDIVVPNAFTPNDDLVNDIFSATAVSVKTFQMQVFNRWGETIFLSASIGQGWNGTFKNTKCETGIYWWVANYSVDGKEQKEKSGSVMLVR
ncbi:MAG: gliding motility-associated C-terminal domain-containing protein [Bacteroidia bacterium]